MSHETPQNLNWSTKRPRTFSTPTSDHELPTRPFSREASMIRDKDGEAGVSSTRPTPGVQYHDFQQAQPKTEIAQASAVPHYLVPYSWFQKFIGYVQDGSGIAPPELRLDELEEFLDTEDTTTSPKNGRDVKILQVEQWTLLQTWYGREDEQCVRHSYKLKDGTFVLEYRPTQFYFSLYTPPSSFTELKQISMYKYKDVEGLYEKVRHAFNISPTYQVRFWHTTESAGLTNLSNAKEAITKTYDRVSIGTVTGGSTSFIVETRQNAAEKWQLEGCKKAQFERTRAKGTKGLTNLGNTCYMASALQCLTHVKELSEYFLSGYYSTEVNTDNPLGYDGKVATSFAKLLKQLYSDDSQKSVAPRELKTILGNINQSFGGYQQQDSQELLAFLLDALHEDLNRIVKKPATERPDIGDVDNTELLRLGEEAWRVHKLRNDSVIVDLFQGIYKSTLVCPICSHVSITFDPFSDLSLPLPFRSYWSHDIYYVPLHGSIVKMTLEFEQNASIGQVISYLAKRFDVKATFIAGAEVWKHRFYKIYENYMPVTTIEKSDEAYFYELDYPDPRSEKVATSIWIPVYTNRRVRTQDKVEECGVPFPVILSEDETKNFDSIQSKLIKSYARFTTSSDLISLDETMGSSKINLSEGEASHDTSQRGSSPFVIKVGPHKIGTSFYGGSEPIPLRERLSKSNVDIPTLDLDDALHSAQTTDDLPPYDEAPLAEIRTTTASPASDDDPRCASDVEDRMIHSRESLKDRDASDPEDLGMMDASDEESLHGAGGISQKFTFHQEDRPQLAIDALPTPQSTPTTPLSENMTGQGNTAVILVTPKDALYCEWPEVAYDELFSEDQNTIGGKSRWEDYDLQVDEAMDARRVARESTKHNTKSLEDCLDEFAKEEPLDAENTWYCPKCKEHQRANKTFELWRSGDILVFHLKRFSSSRSLSDKIDAEIRFPVRGLDLSERLGERRLKAQKGDTNLEDSIYDLTGVVNHYGGLGGGHYTAFAQTFSEEGYQDFHNFNGEGGPVQQTFGTNLLDSSVNPMDSENLISSSAYLLFYRRRSSRPLGADLQDRLSQYVDRQQASKPEGSDTSLEDDVVPRQSSTAPYHSEDSLSSPTTSASADTKATAYVPFIGPGHQLGGVLGDAYRASPAPSNPFGGGTWGLHAATRFGTTNSETSERPDSQFPENENENENEDSVSWSNSD
ncbi:protein of unknown function [Taphrina deformans PYCC 5710]|uniref:ubiquitinyl hydrolase 1 n=1 Tax=Taphrina deformans (strain PYCC 5710 / ATCC 11124 / CBS 356.35 / IMI 108563 / JCM 9778 / NBRC 8474) TaxID=1097556 RepID=R4XFC7_TAPDE|nr:protein of unknown function [Taphrina deformans PYCC 5710]|eukprot:CCG84373.1 protein of unknown function [Taphrina deformans PYCC 5710]